MSITGARGVAARVSVRQLLDREGVVGAMFVGPALLIVVCFLVLPIALAMGMAFMRIDLTRSTEWSFYGLGNFAQIQYDDELAAAIPRTLYFAFVSTAIILVVSVGVALFLNERFPGQRWMRLVVLLPWAVAPVATGVTWRLVFDYSYGLLNAVLFTLGLIPNYVGWLTDGTLAMHAAILGTVWLALPFASLIILARLQQIPDHLYSAALMDGAGVGARFRYLTFPMLRTSILIVVLVELITNLQTFDVIYSLTKGGPANDTTVFNLLVYQRAMGELRFGYASSLALIQFVLAVIVMSGAFALARVQRRQMVRQ